MRIVIAGCTRVRKRNQGKLAFRRALQDSADLHRDLLRAAVAAGTPLGPRPRPPWMPASGDRRRSAGMIRERLSARDTHNGFHPGRVPTQYSQAQALDQLLTEIGKPLELTLLIDVDFDILMQRLTGRRTCGSCGWACNIYSSPPRVDGICDACGGNLHHRADDNEEDHRQPPARLRKPDRTADRLLSQSGQAPHCAGIGEIKHIFAAITKIFDQTHQQARSGAVQPKGGAYLGGPGDCPRNVWRPLEAKVATAKKPAAKKAAAQTGGCEKRC